MQWILKQQGNTMQATQGGTARAYLYYYTYRDLSGRYIAGRYWFNREVDYGRVSFATRKAARAYCELKDSTAVIITAVTA